MIRRILTAVLLATAAPVLAADPPVTFEKVTITDPAARNATAVELLKPKGWKVTGGMTWHLNLVHQVCFQATVANPNGLEQYEAFPWAKRVYITNPPYPMREGTNYNGRIWSEPMSPEDLFENVTFPGMRRGVKPTSVTHHQMKEVAKAYEKLTGVTVKAVRTRVEYTLKGEAVEEDFYLVFCYNRSDMSAAVGRPGVVSTMWEPVVSPFAVRAAKGKLDTASPTLLTVANSVTAAEGYVKHVGLVQAEFYKRVAFEIQDATALSQMWLNHLRSTRAMQQAVWDHRAATTDRQHRDVRDVLGGVAPYTDGSGTTYVLPNTYKYQWAGPDGTVILTDDANYDPNVGSRHTWAKLKDGKR